MKISANVIFAAILVIVVGGIEYWQYQDAKTQRDALNKQLIELHARLESMDARLAKHREKMQQLEESSIGGVIEGANRALVNGWSEMLENLERELEAAREKFQANRDKSGQSSSGSGSQQRNAPTDDGQGPL